MALDPVSGRAAWGQGLAAWGLVAALAWTLPGSAWKPGQPPAAPLDLLLPTAALVTLLGAVALGLARHFGPGLCASRTLALWEALPVVLWGAGTLALWPAAWGPPGWPALALAWGGALLPGELRWLAATLPPEHPLPAAYGPQVLGHARTLTLLRLLPEWVGLRLPLWIGVLMVLELMLGVRGLGSDWMTRVAVRDRLGLTGWIAAYAALWALGRAGGRKT